MDEEILTAIKIFSIVALLLYGAYKLLTHIKRKKIVCNTSKLLEDLQKINEKTDFCRNIKTKYTQSRKMQSKQKYDRYHVDQLRDEILLDKYHPLQKTLIEIRENQKKYDEYTSKTKKLKSKITESEAAQLGVPYDKYCKIEASLFSAKELKPTLNGELVCVIEYTSPAGRNHYSKSYTYSYAHLLKRTDELQEILKRKESAEFKRKMERSKMTLKMRMAVLERDGRRCQICGARQEDGATLHVDHIIPIARGGKTEMSNLRTLCDMCNQGKKDQILDGDLVAQADGE